MAAVQNGWLDEKAVMMESLTCVQVPTLSLLTSPRPLR